jgi:hypothetical protein
MPYPEAPDARRIHVSLGRLLASGTRTYAGQRPGPFMASPAASGPGLGPQAPGV